VSAPPAELSPAEVVRLFRDCGALLEGHFLLSSGMHSPYYLQCARVLMEPARAVRVCSALTERLRRELSGLTIDAVVAPALGGVVLGYELARQLGVLFCSSSGWMAGSHCGGALRSSPAAGCCSPRTW
jgi:orotate phosphoribosyltransferase